LDKDRPTAGLRGGIKRPLPSGLNQAGKRARLDLISSDRHNTRSPQATAPATNPLQKRTDIGRWSHEHNRIDIADVYTHLQGSCYYENRISASREVTLSGFSAIFG
jgi:hypothetical protein